MEGGRHVACSGSYVFLGYLRCLSLAVSWWLTLPLAMLAGAAVASRGYYNPFRYSTEPLVSKAVRRQSGSEKGAVHLFFTCSLSWVLERIHKLKYIPFKFSYE